MFCFIFFKKRVSHINSPKKMVFPSISMLIISKKIYTENRRIGPRHCDVIKIEALIKILILSLQEARVQKKLIYFYP